MYQPACKICKLVLIYRYGRDDWSAMVWVGPCFQQPIHQRRLTPVVFACSCVYGSRPIIKNRSIYIYMYISHTSYRRRSGLGRLAHI